MLTPRYQLHREQLIARPLDEVFAFFADAGNLEHITPPFLHFRILTPLPIRMEPEAVIVYRLRLFGVSFDWFTRIVLFDPEWRFIDRQIAGPHRLWHHLHEFQAVEGGTLIRDVVDYELPLGPPGALAHGLWVWCTLERIFDYRRDRVAAIFGVSASLFQHGSVRL